MFFCNFCSCTSVILPKHILHQSFHRNLSQNIYCGFNGCDRKFKHIKSLRVHVFRTHNVRPRQSMCTQRDLGAIRKNGKFECSINICQKEFDGYEIYIKHLKYHMQQSESVKCPYNDCTKSYSNVNSFKSHISKQHRSITSEVTQMQNEYNENLVAADFTDEDMTDMVSNSCSEENYCPTDSDSDFQNLFILNLAQLYLKLEAEFLIPVSSVQYLVTEIGNIHHQGVNMIQTKVREILGQESIEESTIEKIIKNVWDHDPFANGNHILRTDYRRKSFYTAKLLYVQPQAISLNIPGKKSEHFHYVSIIDTLKAVFNDKNVQSFLPTPAESSSVLHDFYDGSVFKSNEFFNNNPDSLKIILYQDGFEVVNPIGAAKSKYKLLAVYLSVGNLPDYLRTHTKTIQLIALCKEKYFSHNEVFEPIVRDLKEIENGIELWPGKNVKGSVVFIAGDNLGSHSLGGFQENFSVSQYFCRFCLIKRSDFWPQLQIKQKSCSTEIKISDTEEMGPKMLEKTNMEANFKVHKKFSTERNEISSDLYEISSEETDKDDSDSDSDVSEQFSDDFDFVPHNYETRTVQSYKKALKEKKNNSHFQGIKFDSIFNNLQHFHVCNPGLPCCLGHDLFEGIVAYDLFIIIQYFVQKKWFTYSYLNESIDRFEYAPSDTCDKPAKVPAKGKRIIGGAWQIWTFLRLFSLLIGHKIQDANDEVWIALLKLMELSEIICAPQIHKSYVPYLHSLINDYLGLRKRGFPSVRLRPKHHYLTHYPELTLKFGPLMKVFTLRFESKHSFFKSAMRNLRCYKNVTLSLAEKHELLQSLLRSRRENKPQLETDGESDFSVDHFSQELKDAVHNAHLIGLISECRSVVYKGTCYNKGDILALRQAVYQCNVEMGRIIIILLLNDKTLYFLVEVLETEFDSTLRLYELGSRNRYECISADFLLSYEPVPIYKKDTTIYAKPKYGLVKSPLC